MSDLKNQIRFYYEATTVPVDVDAIAVDTDTVIVGPMPDAVRRRSAMKTIPAQTTTSERWKGPRVAWAAFLGAVALVAFVVFVLATDSNDSDVASNHPASVIQDYTAAYNAGDIDRLLELFTNQSVIDTGDAIFGGPFAGLEQIRSHLVRELDKAAEVDALQISKVQVSGNTVTWDQALTLEGGGESYCSEGSSAVVEDGSILSLKVVLAQQRC